MSNKVINVRESIANCLNEKTSVGKKVSWAIQSLIIVSLVSLSIHTLPSVPENIAKTLEAINVACMLIFVTEYSLRVYTAKKVFKYMFSFYGIIDAISIIPYFLGLGRMDSSSLRAFRLLRIFQLLKIARYNKAIKRFYSAFKIAKEELTFFMFITLIILYLTSIGIYHFEHIAQPEAFASVLHSFWWAVITLTTVGYGDVYPITAGGKCFTVFILFVGLGIVSVPAGMLASALSEARRLEDKDD